MDELPQPMKPDAKPDAKPDVKPDVTKMDEPMEMKDCEPVSLVLSRTALKDFKVHYIAQDRDTHTLCGSKIFSCDRPLPLIVNCKVRHIDCISCKNIVKQKSKEGLVKIARPKKRADTKRGKPIKDRPPVDDGIISINRNVDMQQQLPFGDEKPLAAVALSGMFSKIHHDFGLVLEGDEPIYDFKIANPFNEEVRIASISCTSPYMEVWLYGGGQATGFHNKHKISCSYPIHPQSETKLSVKLKSRGCQGEYDATITVEFERPSRRQQQLFVYSKITKRFGLENPNLA